MNFEQYEKAFRIKAKISGFSEENTQACLAYAKPLIDKELPVIYNTTNLGSLVGYKTSYLKKAAVFTGYFYRKFCIKKKNGKMREIVEPLPSLKEIQAWILENILYVIPISKYAKAYIKDKTIIENVKYHRGKQYVLSLDIIDFFGSIKRRKIEQIFKEMGYSSNISNLLSKLCCYDEKLAQGASTSPYLSNLYLRHFDSIVSRYCNQQNIRYTRYADDLTFSSDKEIYIEEFIREELLKINLHLNDKKRRLMGRNERQFVTGIVVNDKLQVPKKNRNKIRNEVYYLTHFGLEQHLVRTNNTKNNYLEHLLGKINFVLHINPQDNEMKKYKQQIIALINPLT